MVTEQPTRLRTSLLSVDVTANQSHAPQRQLNWFDSTSIIVGTIIGAGIYQTPPQVASSVSSVSSLYGLWLIGGLFSLFGAMSYAELASAFPRTGGDYVYLRQAYGPWASFIFGWMQILVIRPGDIAIVAFLFATYFQSFLQADGDWTSIYAASAVGFFTLLNILGVRQSKGAQNLLTSLKIVGLLGIVVVAVMAPEPKVESLLSAESTTSPIPISVALILVLFTYGGWNEMTYIAAEVKHPERNIARSLVGGTVIVTLIYLLINWSYLRVLGKEAMGQSTAIATETVEVVFPSIGGKLVSLLICVSTLGTVNGMILTGARISYAMGADHRLFRGLGHWDPRTGTPVIALIVQGLITLTLILLLRSFVSAVLYTSAAVYTFYFATSVALIVLRYRLPAWERPYRVPFFPIPTVLFAATCLFLVYGAVQYRPQMALYAIALAFIGWVAYRLNRSS